MKELSFWVLEGEEAKVRMMGGSSFQFKRVLTFLPSKVSKARERGEEGSLLN